MGCNSQSCSQILRYIKVGFFLELTPDSRASIITMLSTMIIFLFLVFADLSVMEDEKKKVLKLLKNLVLSSKGGVQIDRLNRKS